MSTSFVFHVIQEKESLVAAFGSTLENVDRFCNRVTEFFAHGPESVKPHLFSINLAMREGLTNAVRHGNCLDGKKLVHCSVRFIPSGAVSVEIRDQGIGFNWQKACLSPGEEDAEHGRGLGIIRQYVTKFFYNKQGNCLFFEKEIL